MQKLDELMGSSNEKKVLRHIILNGKASRTDLSRALSLSMSTLTNVTEKLMSKNLLYEDGVQKTERGRSFTILKINKKRLKSIGIGITAQFISVYLIDLGGDKHFFKKTPLEQSSWQENYRTIIEILDTMLEENKQYAKDILGIGLAPPAFIEYEMKNLDKKYPFGDEWKTDHLIEMLEKRYEIGVTTSSSFSCLLLGESFFGSAREFRNVLYINVSSAGLSWARIENNRIDRNVSRNFNSIGHLVVNINGPQCKCSQHGCVELYTGREALVGNYLKLSAIEEDSMLQNNKDDPSEIDYHKILEYAEEGDYIAVQSVSKAATILGIALGNVAIMIHPEMIILSGRIAKESPLFFELVKKTVNDRLRVINGKEVKFATPTAFSTTDSVGFATLVFEQIFLDY